MNFKTILTYAAIAAVAFILWQKFGHKIPGL